METFIPLVLLIVVGFLIIIAGLVTIDNKISEIQKTVNEFYEINKKFGEVNDTLISIGRKGDKTSLDLCEHIKDVIALNTKLIKAVYDTLNSLKDKH